VAGEDIMIDTTNGNVDTLILALPTWVLVVPRDRILKARDTLLRWIEASEAEERAARVAGEDVTR